MARTKKKQTENVESELRCDVVEEKLDVEEIKENIEIVEKKCKNCKWFFRDMMFFCRFFPKQEIIESENYYCSFFQKK